MCYCTDYDMPEFFDQRMVKARKDHRCYECRGDIYIGWQYERSSGKWDGEVSTYKTCKRCVEIREWMKQFAVTNKFCFCPTFGGFYQEIINCELEKWDVLIQGCPYPETVIRFCWFGEMQTIYHDLLVNHEELETCSCALAQKIRERATR